MQTKIASIRIPENRQRQIFKGIEELADSLSRLGQIQPIVIDEDLVLIAGERRIKAAIHLGWETIEASLMSSLSPAAREAVELEENIKRSDLEWWERVKAILRYHEMREAGDEGWAANQTAEELGLSPAEISRCISVGKALRDDPSLQAMSNLSSAYNYVQRKMERGMDAALANLLSIETEEEDEEEGAESRQPSERTASAGTPSSPPISYRASPSRFQVINLSFLDMARETPGTKLHNFIHCDFPYGVNMGTNALQGTRQDFKKYEDGQDIYIALIDALIENQDRICHQSCHIMFWYSMNFHAYTVNRFSEAGWNVNPFPLIWLKSDGKGLLPDPQRGPRRVYETALMMSRGDRKIVRPVSNAIALPTRKSEAEHLSEKPVPVLEHFFRMFVDESTELLDPTAGSGTAIVAALNAGASRAIGLEIDAEFAETSNRRIRNALLEPRLQVPALPAGVQAFTVDELLDGVISGDLSFGE